MIRCKWDGSALIPAGHYGLSAAREIMEPGDLVIVEIDHPRSQSTHKHQFAEIADAWRHLPEAEQSQPWATTPETLRKHALIACGYCHSAPIDCGTNAAATRVAPPLHAEANRGHGYAITVIRGPVVTLYTPESQSQRAMGGKRFQESKSAVLDWIAAKIGVTPEQLRGAA